MRRTHASSYIPRDKVPAGNWVSYSDKVEFLAAANDDSSGLPKSLHRQLKRSTVFDNPYAGDLFVDGNAEYDEYQQAWRMLGFMIDCDDWSHWNTGDDDTYQYQNNGSGDAGTADGCRRYVLWAAYIDLDYQGDGIGEYQFWDRSNNKWDTTACSVSGTDRCAKMDCHLEDTHWNLLGFFKHRAPDDWMEQLFKHEGMCVWTQEEYEFMGSARKTWPEGCLESSTTDGSGNPIYYHIKPTASGTITMGLYTDTQCIQEYKSGMIGDPVTVENVVGNFLAEGGSGSGDNDGEYDNYSLDQMQAKWDDAFAIFKICQPCVAYDLNNYGYGDNAYGQGSSYGTYNYGYDDDYYQVQGNDFDCYDDAGYTNVNQCMKFAAKTYMDTASIRDVVLGARQGNLVDTVPVQGVAPTSNNRMFRAPRGFDIFSSLLFLCVALGVLIYGAISFQKARSDANYAPNWSMKQPLVFA